MDPGEGTGEPENWHKGRLPFTDFSLAIILNTINMYHSVSTQMSGREKSSSFNPSCVLMSGLIIKLTEDRINRRKIQFNVYPLEIIKIVLSKIGKPGCFYVFLHTKNPNKFVRNDRIKKLTLGVT